MPPFTQRIIDKYIISHSTTTKLERVYMCLAEILFSHYGLLALQSNFKRFTCPIILRANGKQNAVCLPSSIYLKHRHEAN